MTYFSKNFKLISLSSHDFNELDYIKYHYSKKYGE